MKIIEWLKELKLILKKIQSNQQRIGQLSSLLSNEKPLVWNSDKDQAKEVMSLVQSTFDLEVDYLKIKLSIEKTNNATNVTIDWITKTITEWLTTLRQTQSIVKQTMSFCSTKRAEQLLARLTSKEWIEIIPCFDEKKVTEIFSKYIDTVERISSTLEVINATTDLV